MRLVTSTYITCINNLHTRSLSNGWETWCEGREAQKREGRDLTSVIVFIHCYAAPIAWRHTQGPLTATTGVTGPQEGLVMTTQTLGMGDGDQTLEEDRSTLLVRSSSVELSAVLRKPLKKRYRHEVEPTIIVFWPEYALAVLWLSSCSIRGVIVRGECTLLTRLHWQEPSLRAPIGVGWLGRAHWLS